MDTGFSSRARSHPRVYPGASGGGRKARPHVVTVLGRIEEAAATRARLTVLPQLTNWAYMFVDPAETPTPRRCRRTRGFNLGCLRRPGPAGALSGSRRAEGDLARKGPMSRGAEEIIEARSGLSDARRKRGGNAINQIWRDLPTNLYGKNRSTDIKRRWY